MPPSLSEELTTSKAFQTDNTFTSSMPEASWHDFPSLSHLGFIPAGSLSSAPECILKMPFPVQSSGWRRFPICFSHLDSAQEKQVCTGIIATCCCGLTGAQGQLSPPGQPGPAPIAELETSAQGRVASHQPSLTPQLPSCSPGVPQLPFSLAGFPCCYLVLIFNYYVGTVHLLQ